MSNRNSSVPDYLMYNAKVGQLSESGQPQYELDKLALKSYFIDYINQNTVFFHDLEEKIDYLIQHDYYKKEVLDQYKFSDIKELYKLAYSYKFRFKSFAGALKFYQAYALKTDDRKRFLERYEDRVVANALELARGDIKEAQDIIHVLITNQYQPATPTFTNTLRKRAGSTISCFLIKVEDSFNSIGRSITNSMNLSKMGGGVALCLSDIRESGAPIKGIDGLARGPIPIMKLYDDAFDYADQLGTRPGAGAVYISCHHMDIQSVLDTKRENADPKARIRMLSLGVNLTDIFWKCWAQNKRYYTFSTYDLEKHYGKGLAYLDITKNYDKLVSDERIRKKSLDPEQLLEQMAQIAGESGYPYILNQDTVNKAHALDGYINMSNLCSEIVQLNEPSILNDDGSYKTIGRDISCNLGSLNVVNLMENQDLYGTIRTATRALSSVSDQSDIRWVPSIVNGNNKTRAIGLGVMNLHSFLAKEHIHYGSEESIDFTDFLFMLINYYSLKSSCELAKEKTPFFEFEKSRYASGEYFNYYLNRHHIPLTGKVRDIFSKYHIPIPNKADWEDLAEDIMKHGLYNGYRIAVAPTGSISYVNYSSSSIHPVAMKLERRDEKGMGSVYVPAPYMTKDNQEYFTNAYDLGPKAIIDVYAAATPHVDQSLSLTLFYGDGTTTKEVKEAYAYAYMKGIKTMYYIRVQKTQIKGTEFSECLSCEV